MDTNNNLVDVIRGDGLEHVHFKVKIINISSDMFYLDCSYKIKNNDSIYYKDKVYKVISVKKEKDKMIVNVKEIIE